MTPNPTPTPAAMTTKLILLIAALGSVSALNSQLPSTGLRGDFFCSKSKQVQFFNGHEWGLLWIETGHGESRVLKPLVCTGEGKL